MMNKITKQQLYDRIQKICQCIPMLERALQDAEAAHNYKQEVDVLYIALETVLDHLKKAENVSHPDQETLGL
jgi:hypothetical protein